MDTIANFQSFINSPDIPDNLKPKREAWIRALQSGENPFTPEVLEELRNEWEGMRNGELGTRNGGEF